MTWHGEFDYDGGLGGSKWEIPVESSGSLGYDGGLRFDDWEMSDYANRAGCPKPLHDSEP